MSGIVLTEVADATIPTPAAGKVTVYMSVEEAGPAFKDDAAAVTPLQGAAGGTGATGPGYGGTSTTSLAIGTGSKAFTTQAGRAYVAGSRVRAASDADPDADWMEGVASAYSGTTLTVLIDLTGGSGTHTDWNLSLAGEAPAAWMGPWDSGTAYTEGDAVSNDGSSYVCILAHTNEEPPDAGFWDVLAAGAGSDLDAIITASSGQDIADALAGAAAPDAGNVFATMADVGGGGGITRTTQGTTSAGASFQGARGVYLKKLTLASAGLVASIVAHIKGDATNLQGVSVGIFADNAGTPSNVIAMYPGGLLGDSSTYSTFATLSATARDVTFPIGAWLAAGDYWFAVRLFGANDNFVLLAYAAGTGSDRTQAGSTGWQDHSVTATSAGTNDHTIYINVLR